MEALAPKQPGIFPGPGNVVWKPWGQKGRLRTAGRALPCSGDGTWRCRQLKLLSKMMTSSDVCFRNINLLAL